MAKIDKKIVLTEAKEEYLNRYAQAIIDTAEQRSGIPGVLLINTDYYEWCPKTFTQDMGLTEDEIDDIEDELYNEDFANYGGIEDELFCRIDELIDSSSVSFKIWSNEDGTFTVTPVHNRIPIPQNWIEEREDANGYEPTRLVTLDWPNHVTGAKPQYELEWGDSVVFDNLFDAQSYVLDIMIDCEEHNPTNPYLPQEVDFIELSTLLYEEYQEYVQREYGDIFDAMGIMPGDDELENEDL